MAHGNQDLGRDTSGGGVINRGTLIVNNTTFVSNHAVLFGGGIASVGVLAITNSLFVGNSSAEDGAVASVDPGTMMVVNSTFSANVAGRAGINEASQPHGS